MTQNEMIIATQGNVSNVRCELQMSIDKNYQLLKKRKITWGFLFTGNVVYIIITQK